LSYKDDLEFFKKFLNVRMKNKRRFINWLKKKVDFEDVEDSKLPEILFDFMPKRIDENKR
jgi:glucan phosphorylase